MASDFVLARDEEVDPEEIARDLATDVASEIRTNEVLACIEEPNYSKI